MNNFVCATQKAATRSTPRSSRGRAVQLTSRCQPHLREMSVPMRKCSTILLAAFALGVTSLTASSEAAIIFGGWPSGSLPSDISVVNSSEVLVQNPNLKSTNPLMNDANSVSYSESFSVTESGSTLIHADMENVVGSVTDGSLTLSADIDSQLIYTSTTTNFFLDGTTTSLASSGGIPIALGAGLHHVLYTASYTGFDNGISHSSIPSFNLAFSEAPEPSSLCLGAIGLGLCGLVAHRRRRHLAVA